LPKAPPTACCNDGTIVVGRSVLNEECPRVGTWVPVYASQDPHSFLGEFTILLRFGEKRLNKKYRLPTIHGLVCYLDKPGILGMSLNRIDNEDTLANWFEMLDPPHSLKEKGNRQIKDTVRASHRHEIVWANVKPDNVLIDCEQNSWLIDFGGCFNSGDVDEDVMETIEGDL
jgi:hypothetical protein